MATVPVAMVYYSTTISARVCLFAMVTVPHAMVTKLFFNHTEDMSCCYGNRTCNCGNRSMPQLYLLGCVIYQKPVGVDLHCFQKSVLDLILKKK